MVENIKLIRVFVGSPQGLEAERESTSQIVDEINLSHSEKWGCQIKLVRWQQTLPSFDRAQSLINQDLDKCDYFIGILWDKWGSKPADSVGQYTSGFEEEFYRARAHVENGKMKDMAMFFRETPEKQKADPGEELQKVMKFREKCIGEHKIFFKDYGELPEFERVVRRKLEKIGWDEQEKIQTLRRDDSESEKTTTHDREDEQRSFVDSTGLFEPEAIKFISEVMQCPRDWDETSPYDVARFRLIATSIKRSGNDNTHLGNHDSNLIFRKRNELDFSPSEVEALIDCGVAGFKHQNVPVWHWMAKGGKAENMFKRV